MGVCSTLCISREAALTAIARKEFGHLTDDQLTDRLNEHLSEGDREPLQEVEIRWDASSLDESELQRISSHWSQA